MRTKTLKLLTAITVFGVAAVAVGGLILNSGKADGFVKAEGDVTRSMSITAADLEAVGNSGTVTIGLYDQFTFADVSYETIDAKRYIVFNQNSYIISANAAGTNASAGNLRGAGYTSIVLKDKLTNTGSGIHYYDAEGNQLEYVGVGAESGLDHTINFPTSHGEIPRFRYGNVGGGGYVKFTSIQLNYKCESASPSLAISTPTDAVTVGGELAISRVFKNVGGTTPTIEYNITQADTYISIANNTITGVAAGTATVTEQTS